MWESIRFCHVAYSMKKIEILLNHIRDIKKLKKLKKKLKIEIFYLFWFNVSILLFVTFFIQSFKTTICFIWFNFSKLLLSLAHKKTLCIFIHPFNFYSFVYICPQLFMPFHLKYTQTKNDVIYLQPLNTTCITPTLQGRGLAFSIQWQ